MATRLGPLAEPGAETSLLQINQELRFQLEKCKQDFRDLKEKFLISEATAYSLANQLQKYQCEQSTDIIGSVLGEKAPCEQGKRADSLAEKLRQCHILIQDQDKELTRLYRKLQEGKDISQLLAKHLEDLLTHDEAEHGFQEQMAEGRRLAKCLARKLSPENYDNEEDDNDKEETPTPSMEQQEVTKKEVLPDTGDECVLTPSAQQEGCDSDQCYRDGKLHTDDEELGSAQDIASECSHSKGAEPPRDPPENQMDPEGLKEEGSFAPRLSTQLPEVGEQDSARDSPGEGYLKYSVLPDLSDSYWPYRSAAIFSPEALDVCSSLDAAKNQFCLEEKEEHDPRGLRLSTNLPEGQEQDAQREALDECYLTYSSLPDLSDSRGTSSRADITSFEDQDIGSSLDKAKSHNDLLEEKDQDPICPSPPWNTRLHGELPMAEENDVPRDSLDECYLTSSIAHDLPDTCRPSTSASPTCVKQETFLGLDGDAPSHQGPSNGTLTFQSAEVQTSGAQTQTSPQGADSLQQPLDQQLDCGDGRARLGLSFTIGSLDAKTRPQNQWPLCPELALDASVCMKNPPKLEGDAAEGSRDGQEGCPALGHTKTLHVMREKIPKRKVQFGPWRLACRFRGLQA